MAKDAANLDRGDQGVVGRHEHEASRGNSMYTVLWQTNEGGQIAHDAGNERNAQGDFTVSRFALV